MRSMIIILGFFLCDVLAIEINQFQWFRNLQTIIEINISILL